MASLTCLTASLSGRYMVPGSSCINIQSRYDRQARNCSATSRQLVGRNSSSVFIMNIAMAGEVESVVSRRRRSVREARPLASELWGRRGSSNMIDSDAGVEFWRWKGGDAGSRRGGKRRGQSRAAAAVVMVSERVISLGIAVGLPLVLGSANAIINNPSSSFYRDLKKPSFNPPNWLFGVAWGLLYPVMGLASWLVWSEGGFQQQAIPLTSYVVQLGLNLLWPPIFFTAHKLQAALLDLVALVLAVAITAYLFRPINPLAFYLFLPYLAWVSFAAFLNYKYVTLNTSSAPSGGQPQPA